MSVRRNAIFVPFPFFWVGAADGRVCFERSCVGVCVFCNLVCKEMQSPEVESAELFLVDPNLLVETFRLSVWDAATGGYLPRIFQTVTLALRSNFLLKDFTRKQSWQWQV